MDKKRKRPYRERACKARVAGATDPVYLDPKLWRKLPPEVAYMVLSFLPVDKLIDTLRGVKSKWEKLLRCQAFAQIFGHGDNLNSSYGMATLARRSVARLMAFEHESQEWREFPKKLHSEMKKAKLISGSRDGLMLCESKTCRFTGRRFVKGYCSCIYPEHQVHIPDVGVWNPLLRSLKWLPENPYLITKYIPYYCSTFYAVMVDEPSRSYQVFQLMYFYHRTRKFFYSVYSSTTGSWRSIKSVAEFFPTAPANWKGVASCDRYIFLHSYENRLLGDLERLAVGCRYTVECYIYWYDAKRDRWDRVFVSQILADLGYSRAESLKYPASVENFVILHGVLYTLIRMYHVDEERGERIGEIRESYVLASVDISALGGELGAASLTFKLEAVVPDGFRLQTSSDKISEASFNFYCYTIKRKGYIGVRTSKSGHFLHFDVSKGDWLEYDKYPEVGVRNWETGKFCFPFKPSLVVP